MTKIKEIISVLEGIAPPQYQESYDNSGLLLGSSETKVSGVLVSLDVTEMVVEEALKLGCNLIVAHHPLIFQGLKKIDPDHWIGRVVIKAIKHDIAIFAIHTNLDNVLQNGVNSKIAKKLGLNNCKILLPTKSVIGFEVQLPILLKEEALTAVKNTHPLNFRYWEAASGISEKRSIYVSGELAEHQKGELKRCLQAFGLNPVFNELQTKHPELGAGLIGELDLPLTEKAFLNLLKEQLRTPLIKHTELLGKSVLKIAVCGGSGSFLLAVAKSMGADVLVSGDFKYHDFFEADRKILVADVGHFESEQYTIELIIDILKDNFSTFALHYTQVNTNPVNYF